jgi:hypothetical protein
VLDVENEETDLNFRLLNIEEKIKDINLYKDSGWNSIIEKYIISAGLFLLISCFIIVSYNAIYAEITISDKLISIITILLGYLFGYLPLKTSEASAVKKLKELEEGIKRSQEDIKILQGSKNIADTSLETLSKIRDENGQLREAINKLKTENEEYKNYLKKLVDLE